ncbi:Predicted ATP-dependent carboligase, ATP-grasp superfamily [Marinobacter sp. es.042]|uniref:carboxylate--amine ligase n=1 Tax=Marinobacter sp. es.042 TaxID=1761794 RepID=UPI000B4FF61B|nr:ATP-grasp domain-containing protein [Marinobacter sp. es.042]SNB55486.1 Predicted ATP-dependent carboligase, ATP-grasp superfamily [Marinobacter sp. es.042]
MEVGAPRVLVLDANQRSALAVTRSLGRSGQFSVYTADSIQIALAGASRFSKHYFRYPDPIHYPREFVSWLRNIVSEYAFELVMPTTEITSQLILYCQSELPEANLPFASYDRVMKLADKISLVKLAKSNGVTVPQSSAFQSSEEVRPEDLRFPVVIKPALSRIYKKGHWLHTQVRVVQSLVEWQEALEDMPYLQDNPFMLQEFIPGHGGGVFCLYDKGRPVQFFAHQRLREKPPEGGVSVLSRSVPVDKELKQAAEKLLSEVQWHGVAMVEFRISNDGTAYLMEINTRFWGSLQLAIDAGIDFPLMLANLHLGRPIEQTLNYRYDQRLRWLLGDLDSLYLFLKRPHSWQRKLLQVCRFLSVKIRHQKHEVNRLGDLKPAWIELKQYIQALKK